MRIHNSDLEFFIFTSAAAFMLQCAASFHFFVNIPLDDLYVVSYIDLSNIINFWRVDLVKMMKMYELSQIFIFWPGVLKSENTAWVLWPIVIAVL